MLSSSEKVRAHPLGRRRDTKRQSKQAGEFSSAESISQDDSVLDQVFEHLPNRVVQKQELDYMVAEKEQLVPF